MAGTLKTKRALLASAARTVATTTAIQTDMLASAARFYLNITAASGTGGLTWQLLGYDPVSGVSAVLAADTTAIIATGMYVFETGQFTQAAANNVRVHNATLLPWRWAINLAVGDASSYTYSLGAEVLP